MFLGHKRHLLRGGKSIIGVEICWQLEVRWELTNGGKTDETGGEKSVMRAMMRARSADQGHPLKTDLHLLVSSRWVLRLKITDQGHRHHITDQVHNKQAIHPWAVHHLHEMHDQVRRVEDRESRGKMRNTASRPGIPGEIEF